MFAKNIGIDLGTANVLIYVQGSGVVLNEPSVVVFEKKSGKPIAFGEEAYNMIGRTPEEIKVIKPLKDGVIADFESTEIMLNYFISKSIKKSMLSKPKILICCPTNITEVEKNAIREAAERTGAKKVYIEEEPKVAAIGAGMDINKASGSMVVDIGGGTTDVAVLSLGGIVTSASIRVAGNEFDSNIVKYIKDKYKLLIGEKTAENIKKTIGSAVVSNKKSKTKVKGRDLVGGLPKEIEINQEEIQSAIEPSLEKICNTIKFVLEQTPPELSSDIMDKGIMLTGGGAMLNNIKEYFESKLKVPILLAEDPLMCVVLGTSIILDNLL